MTEKFKQRIPQRSLNKPEKCENVYNYIKITEIYQIYTFYFKHKMYGKNGGHVDKMAAILYFQVANRASSP